MADTLTYSLERIKLLQDWARYTAERLMKSIRRRGIGYSGALYYSIMHRLVSVAGGDVSSIKHEFNYYGKFVDMGVGRGQKIESVKSNADLIALTGEGRRPKKWYSKTYYAEVQELQELLSEKYGQQSIGIIKEHLDFKAA